MKEIKKLEKIYLEDFDIYVNRYLTYAEIQSIIDAVVKLDKWADRQTMVDLLVLTYATSMTKEEIANISHDGFLCSGLIDQVMGCIENLYQITDALSFTTSLANIAGQFLKQVPELTEQIKKVQDKVANKYANSKK